MHNKLIPYIIFGTLLITAFAVGIVISVIIQKQRQFRSRLARQQLAFEHSQSLLNTRIEVRETTLNMLAQELHDHIAQLLTGCFLQVSAAAGYLEEGKGKMIIEEAKAGIKHAIQDVRLLSQSLATGMVEHRELEEAIRAELARIQAFSGIECTFHSDSLLEPQPEQRLLLFRIVQEALQNILKHARAKGISIAIHTTAAHFLLEIADDGIGFDPDAARQQASLGLMNMQHRVGMLRGAWQVVSAPGSGTTIKIEIPVNVLHGNDTDSAG